MRQGASRRPAPRQGGLRLRRVLVFVVVLSLLIGFIYWLQQRRLAPVDMPPAALAEEAPKAPKPSAPPAPRFEFYEILPEQTVLPTRTPSDKTTQRPSVSPSKSEPRWLQTGAFHDSSKAAARLAAIEALGLPGQRQQGFDADGKRLERVVAGPFALRSSLERAQRLLDEQGIAATPLNSLDESQ